MNKQVLIQSNNELRKRLTKENRKYFEDMLVYIRLSYDKSEQETEEILSEMLIHLLEAQENGKSAEAVFGSNPKLYADEIIGELPKMVTRERVKLGMMAMLYFFSVSVVFTGLFRLFNHFVLNMEGVTNEYYIGSVMLKTIISIPIAVLFVLGAMQYLRWACFRNLSKVKDFFILWGLGVIPIGTFVLIFYFIPDVGPVMEIPAWVVLLIGAVLFIAATFVKKSLD